jgi:hypothetical protein
MHRWEKRRPAEILERAHNLTLYTSRMSQFAIVKDDTVTFRDKAQLEKAGVMQYRSAKRKAKIIHLHTRKRKTA